MCVLQKDVLFYYPKMSAEKTQHACFVACAINVLRSSIMTVSDATIRSIIQQVVSNKFSLLQKIQK